MIGHYRRKKRVPAIAEDGLAEACEIKSSEWQKRR
jgi:hypothetical protein